jgi:hypothetical protein
MSRICRAVMAGTGPCRSMTDTDTSMATIATVNMSVLRSFSDGLRTSLPLQAAAVTRSRWASSTPASTCTPSVSRPNGEPRMSTIVTETPTGVQIYVGPSQGAQFLGAQSRQQRQRYLGGQRHALSSLTEFPIRPGHMPPKTDRTADGIPTKLWRRPWLIVAAWSRLDPGGTPARVRADSGRAVLLGAHDSPGLANGRWSYFCQSVRLPRAACLAARRRCRASETPPAHTSGRQHASCV